MKTFFFTYTILLFKMIKPGNNLGFYVYCFALVFFSEILHSKLVNSIKITGNQYTKNHIILREIQHPVPGNFNHSVAQEDRDDAIKLDNYKGLNYKIFGIKAVSYTHVPLPTILLV